MPASMRSWMWKSCVALRFVAMTLIGSASSVHAHAHHSPTFGIEVHGSAGGSAAPRWSSSTEMRSGDRTNAMRPSRGGREIV